MVVEFMEMIERLLGGALGAKGGTSVQYAVDIVRETMGSSVTLQSMLCQLYINL